MPLQRITVAVTGCVSYDHIRIHRPLTWPGMRQALWDAGLAVDAKPFSEITIQSLEATDCLVLHGCATPGIMPLLKKLPCRFAMFQDDLMWRESMPKWNPNIITEAQEMVLRYCLENACAIVATTQPLAEELGCLGKTIVQGNLEDFSAPAAGDSDRMRRAICVAGNSHAGDIELLNGLDWSGDTVVWSSCIPSSKIAAHRDVRGNMTFRPNDPRWGHISPTSNYEEYQVHLKNIAPKFGIGVAPLVDCKFNGCKSILKVLEYIKCGWVPVVSDADPYSDLPDEICVKVGECAKHKEWSAAVEYASLHPENARTSWEWAHQISSYQSQWQQWVRTFRFIAERI